MRHASTLFIIGATWLAGPACGNTVIVGQGVGEGGSSASSVSSTSSGDPTDPACSPEPWVRALGGAGEQSRIHVDVGEDCRVAVTGYTASSFDVGGLTVGEPGVSSVFVLELDGRGRPLWSRSFPVSFGDRSPRPRIVSRPGLGTVVSISFDGSLSIDGQVLTSPPSPAYSDNHDTVIVALGPDGSSRWFRVFGGAGPQDALDITADGGGALYLGGRIGGFGQLGSLTAQSDLWAAFVVRLSPDGTPDWIWQQPGTGELGAILDLEVSSGRIAACGDVADQIVPGDSALGLPTYGLTSFVGSFDASTGQFLAGNTFPHPGGSSLRGVTIDGATIRVVGSFGEADTDGLPAGAWPSAAEVLELDQGLQVVSRRLVEGEGSEGLEALVGTGPGHYVAAGYFSQSLVLGGQVEATTDADYDVFLVDEGGLLETLNTSDDGRIRSLAVDRSARVMLAGGEFVGAMVDPATGTAVVSEGGRDGFVFFRPLP